MDIDTVEFCWSILQRYIRGADEANAVGHLVIELLDGGIRDENLRRLAGIDEVFAAAVAEHRDSVENDYWYVDEDSWE